MHDFEKLGLFYLGRHYDPAAGALRPELVLYDSRDLLTHAVCVGMTGSGKTGLCVGLIEEAAIDSVPVIAIDPKGDLGNLLLTFPNLAPEDFRPWVDEDEARRAGQTPEAFAADQAGRWKEGLAAWGQDGERIGRLRREADFTIFTPGSRAGVPVSILTSFAAPPPAVRDDEEALAERANSTATSVLALAGLDGAPRSREHTLLSALLTAAWREPRDLDLASLIQQLQSPPIQRVGVIDLESYFPARDRFDLAIRLNELLAAPGFEQWLEGEPLDAASLLYTPEGRPRVSIFSIAHLGDAERMFFVSLLLNQVVVWMRTQTGTTSLRAIVCMDEIFGYFPPVANPPSKLPLLTLLKQGRAFGLGVVLATQNPVDLDYKGLANAGTWFLGRLQTERDKARVLDGLEGAAAGSIDRGEADRLLSALGKRVFLMHNVHEKGPSVFQSRWTMSYLRGPLSRDQIKQLTTSVSVARDPGLGIREPGSAVLESSEPAERPFETFPQPPVVPPGIQQFFVPDCRASIPEPRIPTPGLRYTPVVLGAARVTFTDAKLGINETRDVLHAAPLSDGAVSVDWATATALPVTAAQLQRTAGQGATYAQVPDAALRAKNYAVWEKSLASWLAQSETIELLRHAGLKLTSHPGESERDFRIRVQDAQRVARDRAVDTVRKKYAARQAQLAEQLRRAEANVAKETEQASQVKVQTAVSMGATLLNALFGRKALSAGTLGRATTAARGVGRTMKETADIKRAGESAEAVRERARALDEQVAQETQEIVARFEADSPLERVVLTPRRGQVAIQFVALGWVPAAAR